jgi:hypothetical protein
LVRRSGRGERPVVNPYQEIAFSDTCAKARSFFGHKARLDALGRLDPETPVLRHHDAALLLNIETSQYQ